MLCLCVLLALLHALPPLDLELEVVQGRLALPTLLEKHKKDMPLIDGGGAAAGEGRGWGGGEEEIQMARMVCVCECV